MFCLVIIWNLIFCQLKILSHYFTVLFHNAEVKILNKNSEVVATGNMIGNLYMIKFQIDISTALLTSNEDFMYRRMCHSSLLSHFDVVYLLSYKSEVNEKFYEDEAKSKSIQIEYTIPRNPELNGLSEHFNRTLLDLVRCMLLYSKVKKKLWGEAVCATTYVLNRTPTRILKEGCPVDLWYGYCDSRKIRVFGTVAYAHIPKEDVKGKLDPRSKPLIMMGYTANG
ncbi:hypothetical protein PR048_006833 [Dryococelus australis]|uniref:Integrase catalytic domain-containing protein n=1 Tax=Dryococelus australis TaxID=614101 RepID=A0ABQ9IC35_9NEOP|nr:hypothetical protein PR048_006833 [Dryococelus australis]